MPKAINTPTTSASLPAETGIQGEQKAGRECDAKQDAGRLVGVTVMHRLLFLDDDLTGAADECRLTPDANADAEGCARRLNAEAFDALSIGLARLPRPGRYNALKELRAIEKNASALAEVLGLNDPNARQDVLPWAIRGLIEPGLTDPPTIPLWHELHQRVGPDLPSIIENAHEFAEIVGYDQGTSGGQAINRALADAGLQLLAPALDVLLRVVRQASAIIESEEGKHGGRKRDVAADMFLRALARAHVAIFGFPPQLRNEERDRDTPSIAWIKLLLKTAATRAGDAFGPDSREAVTVRRLGSLALATLNNRIAEVMPGNGSATE